MTRAEQLIEEVILGEAKSKKEVELRSLAKKHGVKSGDFEYDSEEDEAEVFFDDEKSAKAFVKAAKKYKAQLAGKNAAGTWTVDV